MKSSTKHRITYSNVKSVVLVCVSLLFLVAGLIYSPVSIHLVFAAAPPHPCFTGANDYDCVCENDPAKLQATCCYTDRITGQTGCQRCDVNTDTGEFENCHNISKGKPGSSTIAPPPSGVAPPPSTQTCPENTALDTNGNCAPLTQGPTDQGTTIQPPISDNNNNPKHHKDSELSQLPPLTGDNNNNNDNKPSKHHKSSDTLTPQSSSTD